MIEGAGESRVGGGAVGGGWRAVVGVVVVVVVVVRGGGGGVGWGEGCNGDWWGGGVVGRCGSSGARSGVSVRGDLV